jgi:hypothetical protein
MLQCYFLEGIGAICDGFLTAEGTQGTESGSQTARKPVRGGNGTSEPGCHGAGTGPDGKLGVSQDIVKFPEGKAGANWTDGH